MGNKTNYLTTKQMAKKFSKSQKTIWVWLAKKIIPEPISLGSQTKVWNESVLDAYLLANNPVAAKQLDESLLVMQEKINRLDKLNKKLKALEKEAITITVES